MRGPAVVTAADLPILHKGAVAASDAKDGVKDGLISDPLRCEFDPHVLVCAKGKAADCISKEVADAVSRFMAVRMTRLARNWRSVGSCADRNWPGKVSSCLPPR